MSLKILLDNPSEAPVLGFEAYASALKEIIQSSDPRFSIGIFGGWGSGKTTLMRTIKRKLDNQIVSVWFNAWRYEKEEHLIVPLLDILREALVTWAKDREAESSIDSSVKDSAIKAASTIAKVARAISAGIAVKAKLPLVEVSLDPSKVVAELRDSSEEDKQVAESSQSLYHASFRALQESLTQFTQHGTQRIVVFIDDLDRCLPSNALQVLESMKLFFDFEGVVFVAGLDQDVIEASINWRYHSSNAAEGTSPGPPISGENYIKKLFQVPFTLPAVSSSQLDEYLAGIISGDEDADTDQGGGLLRHVRPHLDLLVGESGVNPREIKRYVNSYVLQKLIQPDLDDDVALVLQTIYFRPDWRDAYRVFRSDRQAFIEAAKRQLGGEENAIKDFNPRLKELPDSFFKYIGSKGGQKLVDLDVPQLEEHERVLAATQAPENSLASLVRDLDRLVEYMDEFDPTAPESYREILGVFRENISNIQLELQTRIDRGERSDYLFDVVRTLSELKNDGDTLAFMLRRVEDLQPEEFDKFLERRSRIVSRLAASARTLAEYSADLARD